MSNTATIQQAKPTWAGGRSPFNVSYGKLMMWIFLISDIFTFSSLLVFYGATRFANWDVWPSPDMVFNHFPFAGHMHLPLFFVSFMTFVLIFSSVTMVLAVEAGQRMAQKEVAKYMLLTIVGGLIFLSCQAWEWSVFIGEGARMYGNDFGLTAEGAKYAHSLKLFDTYHWQEGYRMTGAPQFSSFFFLVTGFHGLHVFSGVIINLIVYINVIFGTYERRGHYDMVEKVGLYWHFVDLVWVFVFTFFYLI